MNSKTKNAVGFSRSMYRDPKGRLHENFYIANRMKRYANRLRVRLAALDLSDPDHQRQLRANRRRMLEILTKKKISSELADRAVALMLDIAADHRFEVLRRNQSLERMAYSERARQRLTKQLRCLTNAISNLPPLAKGKLNKIIVEQEWPNFDMEMLDELIRAIEDALSKSSPAVAANKAVNAIGTHDRSADPEVAGTSRTAPSVIVELWEIIPAETRRQLEADFRNWRPPTRRSMMEFLNHAVFLLESCRPGLRRGRLPAVKRRFAQRAAAIWHDLGLHVGRAYNGITGYRSTFQCFADLALSAVRDDSKVSSRQITNVKRQNCKRTPSGSVDEPATELTVRF